MPLAIAAPRFGMVSETFIGAHVQTIQPGGTVLLQELPDAPADGLVTDAPILTGMFPPIAKDSPLGRVRAIWRYKFGMALGRRHRRRLADFLGENGTQALLAEFLNTAVLFAAPARLAGVRPFAFAHGYDVSLLGRHPIWQRRYRRMFETVEGVFVASAYLARRLVALGCAAERIHVCPCGIDPGRIRPTRRERGRALAVGRMVPKKAPTATVTAFARALQNHPHAKLDMVGDGPLLEETVRLAHSLDIADRVTFHGALPHDSVIELFSRAEIFLQHSVTPASGDTEGMPVSILEAMASALPVVSTYHSGIPEVVIDGKTGRLVSEHDVAGMADAIDEILSDKATGAEMGDAGRAQVTERFTLERAAERMRGVMGLPEPSAAVPPVD